MSIQNNRDAIRRIEWADIGQRQIAIRFRESSAVSAKDTNSVPWKDEYAVTRTVSGRTYFIPLRIEIDLETQDITKFDVMMLVNTLRAAAIVNGFLQKLTGEV